MPAERGAPGRGAAVGGAGAAPGGWDKGAGGTLEFELLWAGRKAGFDQRTSSVKQTKPLISLASEFLVVSPLWLGNVTVRKKPEIFTVAFCAVL